MHDDTVGSACSDQNHVVACAQNGQQTALLLMKYILVEYFWCELAMIMCTYKMQAGSCRMEFYGPVPAACMTRLGIGVQGQLNQGGRHDNAACGCNDVIHLW